MPGNQPPSGLNGKKSGINNTPCGWGRNKNKAHLKSCPQYGN